MGQQSKRGFFFWRFFGDFSILAFWSSASLFYNFFFLVCFYGPSGAPDSYLFTALLRLFLRLIVWQQIQKQVLAQSHQKKNSALIGARPHPLGARLLIKNNCTLYRCVHQWNKSDSKASRDSHCSLTSPKIDRHVFEWI